MIFAKSMNFLQNLMKYQLILSLLSCFLLSGCAKNFYKNGYYGTSSKGDYYGNDHKKLYLFFSDRFLYRESNFHADKLSDADCALLSDFGITKPKKMLFAYHSPNSRSVIAFYVGRAAIDFSLYEKYNTVDNRVVYFKNRDDESGHYADNIYPFKNRYLRIIEKTYFDKKRSSKIVVNKPEAYIFPVITTVKP